MSSNAARNGPARMLEKADPDTPLDEIGRRLQNLPHWECASCGNAKYTNPPSCDECGGETFEKIPGGEDGAC